jgi:hypothetical protein
MRYAGRLGKSSAPVRPVTTLRDGEPTTEQFEQFETRHLAHHLDGLSLLFKHYEIPDGDLTQRLLLLVFRLSESHVPFFRPAAKSRTKPGPKSDVEGCLRLELDIMNARRPGDRGDLPALKRLILKPAYRHYANAGGEESLRKKRQRARRDPLTRVLLDLQAQITPSGWKLVFDREESAKPRTRRRT